MPLSQQDKLCETAKIVQEWFQESVTLGGLHAWPHRPFQLASITVTDKGVRTCCPSHTETTVWLILLPCLYYFSVVPLVSSMELP